MRELVSRAGADLAAGASVSGEIPQSLFPSVVVHVVLSHSYREARVSDIRRVLSASCALHGADAALYLCGLGDSRNDAANANGSNHRRIVRHSIGILDWAAMPLIPDKRQKAHDCETKAMHVRVVASTLAYRCAPTFGICCLRSTLNHPQPDASGCSREGAWPSWREASAAGNASDCRRGASAFVDGRMQPLLQGVYARGMSQQPSQHVAKR